MDNYSCLWMTKFSVLEARNARFSNRDVLFWVSCIFCYCRVSVGTFERTTIHWEHSEKMSICYGKFSYGKMPNAYWKIGMHSQAYKYQKKISMDYVHSYYHIQFIKMNLIYAYVRYVIWQYKLPKERTMSSAFSK